MDKFFWKAGFSLLIGLILFELLNAAKILDYTADYGWPTLIFINLEIIAGGKIISFLFKRKDCLLKLGPAFFAAAMLVYADSFGNILRLYPKILWYDRFSHFLGGIAAALFFFSIAQALNRCGKIKANALWLFALTFSFSLSAAVFYELAEYIQDMIYASQRIGPGTDTVDDLFMHFLGTAIITIAQGVNYLFKNRI